MRLISQGPMDYTDAHLGLDDDVKPTYHGMLYEDADEDRRLPCHFYVKVCCIFRPVPHAKLDVVRMELNSESWDARTLVYKV